VKGKVAVAVGAASLVMGVAVHTQQSVFRATTDAVEIYVSVRNGDKPVTGLSTADFVVEDNRVPQHVDVLDASATPIDLTAIVDLGFLAHFSDAAEFRSIVRKLGSALAPTDRLRVLTAATEVAEARPLGPPGEGPISNPEEGGAASIDDALLDALVASPTDGRRDVVVVLTRGDDVGSVFRSEAVPAIAERSDAVVELVLVPLKLSTGQEIYRFPVPTANRQALIDAAGRTGGDVFYLSDAVNGVKHAVDDVRESYTLRYTLTNVPKPGWHNIAVKITKPGSSGYRVRARKGYFVPQ
jgi:hypothetical protein